MDTYIKVLNFIQFKFKKKNLKCGDIIIQENISNKKDVQDYVLMRICESEIVLLGLFKTEMNVYAHQGIIHKNPKCSFLRRWRNI